MGAKPMVLEFGMGVDVHGADATTAACRAVSDAIRHSSLPFTVKVPGTVVSATSAMSARSPGRQRSCATSSVVSS